MKIDHTGFCMGQFDTRTCHDCPTIKECLVLYGKDQAVLAVQRVLDRMEIEESAEPVNVFYQVHVKGSGYEHKYRLIDEKTAWKAFDTCRQYYSWVILNKYRGDELKWSAAGHQHIRSLACTPEVMTGGS